MEGHPLPVVRLNGDASWWFRLGSTGVVVDPWLVGSEVDIGPWFNEQWHTEPLVTPADVPAHDVILVSQPYSDHCHTETLQQLAGRADVVVVPNARRKTARAVGDRPVHVIPPWGTRALELRGLRFWRITPPWWRVPAYHAVVIADDTGRAVVHAPHGMDVAMALQVRAELDVAVLAITRTWYALPWWLGGVAQPGAAAAEAVVGALRPSLALSVHDEKKRGRGFVRRVERVEYATDIASSSRWLVDERESVS